MSEKQTFPPVVEIPEGSEDFLAELERDQKELDVDPQTGEYVETNARRFWVGKYAGEEAVQLLARKGELLGVVTRKDQETGEKTPLKVIDLGKDFGTEVQVNNPNYYAGSNKLGLPRGENALKEIFDAREKVRRAFDEQADDTPRAAQPPEVLVTRDPGADYRARRAKTREARHAADEADDEDNTRRSWMVSGY